MQPTRSIRPLATRAALLRRQHTNAIDALSFRPALNQRKSNPKTAKANSGWAKNIPRSAKEGNDRIESPVPANYVQPTIRTLRSEALSPSDHVLFSADQEYCFVWDALATQSSPSDPATEDTKPPLATIRYSTAGTHFPAGLQGFFYYYNYAGPAPRTSGEIRFRKTYSSDPSSFSSGKDLEATHGLPWRLQLLTIAAFDKHRALRDILLRDGLVDEETMKIAAEMGTARAQRKETIPLIHTFRQPFYLDFASPLHWWNFMDSQRLHFSRPMANITSIKLHGERMPPPWLGSAICTFVKSKSPYHQNSRVINVAVLSIVDPVQRNPDFPEDLYELAPTPPRPKSILRRGTRVWALDLDDCDPQRSEGFHVLFENEKLPPLRTGRILGPPKQESSNAL
ncbi:hypothetical protein GY45DRAFT_1254107 [Cubamyces sp. BRFM 1775]|nr:hypothetical protein GY45DRAFT_1254107 [Cubamyces sp. BRFM 1775]